MNLVSFDEGSRASLGTVDNLWAGSCHGTFLDAVAHGGNPQDRAASL